MGFSKGVSGNPAGRPLKIVEDARHSLLASLFNEAAERRVVLAVIRVAARGDVPAATWLWDRKYGKVSDRVQQETSGQMIIRVEYNHADDNADPA